MRFTFHQYLLCGNLCMLFQPMKLQIFCILKLRCFMNIERHARLLKIFKSGEQRKTKLLHIENVVKVAKRRLWQFINVEVFSVKGWWENCDICNSLVIIYSSLINTLSFLTFYIKFLFQVPCNREKKKQKSIQKWRKFELLLSWYASLVHWLYFNHYIQYMVVFVVILTFICYFVYWTPILGRVL